MLQRILLFGCIALLGSLLSGCGSMLPHGENKIISPWKSYAEIKRDYDKVIPGQTRLADLRKLGFSPDRTPNVRILNHLEILNRVAPQNAVGREDLPPGLLKCLKAGDNCQAYEVDVRVTQSNRYGNFLADFFNFRRKVHVNGWAFDAVFVLQGDLVVYKVWNGTPRIQEYRDTTNPLGPLQGIGGDMVRPKLN